MDCETNIYCPGGRYFRTRKTDGVVAARYIPREPEHDAHRGTEYQGELMDSRETKTDSRNEMVKLCRDPVTYYREELEKLAKRLEITAWRESIMAKLIISDGEAAAWRAKRAVAEEAIEAAKKAKEEWITYSS